MSLNPTSPTVVRGAERATAWLVGLILLVAAAFRWHEAHITPMWFDEIFTLWVVRADPAGVMRTLTLDMHPPLHFLWAWAWRAIGGESELWLKTSSMILGLGTILICYGLARDLFDRRAGLLAAAILAVHHVHIYFSQEFRNYAMLWLTLTAAGWMASRWLSRSGAWNAVLFVVAAVATLYTHYLGGVILGFVFLWGAWDQRKDRRRLLQWIGLHVSIAILFVPQMPTFLAQARNNMDEHWIQGASADQLLDLARKLSFGAYYLLPVICPLAVLPLVRPEQRRAASLLWIISAGPALLTYVLTKNGAHLFTERYMFYIVPFWCALVAAGIVGIQHRRVRIAIGVVVMAFAIRSAIVSPPFDEAYSLRKAETWLEPRIQPGDVVFHADAHSLLYFRQHMPDRGRHVLLLMEGRVPYYDGDLLIPQAWRVPPMELMQAHAHRRRWWGVRTRNGGMDYRPAERLLGDASGAPPMEFGPVLVWQSQP